MIPLRILHFVGSRPGPAGDGARTLIAALTRQGHASAVAVPELDEVAPVPAVQVMAYGSGLFASLFGARTEFARTIATWTPDLIHVHDLELLQVALDLARRLSLSVVVSVHGRETAHTARLLRDPRIAWVLLPTESLRAYYLGKIGLGRDRATILPPGVDVAAAGSCRYRTADGQTVIGFSGSFDPSSGIERLCEAIRGLRRDLPVRGLFRPATSEDRERLESLLERTDSQGLIQSVAPEDTGFMSHIDVFADLRTDDRVSVPVLEAMACARPVVALAVGGAPELVRDGQTALLVAPDRSGTLADALRQLTDPALRRVLGEAGRLLAKERYDVAIISEACVELYRVALGDTANSNAKAESSTTYKRISETRIR
ncbi:MAG: glycosyltransferase family 4 protein [Planctomycetes bacterium]|nr:glycosyltransferase family 4 protein [Planctomycetota bacterium]